MDPADHDSGAAVQQAVSHQGVLLGQHNQSIRGLLDANQQLSAQVSELTRQLASLSAPQQVGGANPQTRDSHTTDPEPFSGQSDVCRGFLFQCANVFSLRPNSFSTDISKIQYMCGLMRGRAIKWAEARFSAPGSMFTISYSSFIAEIKRVFDHPDYKFNASSQLMDLRQGQRSVSDYTIEFWTLAAEVDWTEQALQAAFMRGLSERLREELLSRDEPPDLNSLVSLANKIDNRLRSRRRERDSRPPPGTRLTVFPAPNAPYPPANVPGSSTMPEPMQLGRAHLTAEEHQRRRETGACLYCGGLGHFLSTCPTRPKGRALP